MVGALTVGMTVMAAGELHTVVLASALAAVVRGADGVDRFYYITEMTAVVTE